MGPYIIKIKCLEAKIMHEELDICPNGTTNRALSEPNPISMPIEYRPQWGHLPNSCLSTG